MGKPVIQPAAGPEAGSQSAEILERIGEALGGTPNIYRTAAHSPAALQSLWFQVGAAANMALTPRLREMIALRVAQFNGCSYSLALHTKMAKGCGIGADEVADCRKGFSRDQREQALLNLVTRVVENRGHHSGFEVEAVRRHGVSNAEIVEVIALVGLYTYTNYLDCVANTEIDYPAVDNLGTAAD